MDEMVFVITDHLMAKHRNPQRALKRLRRHFATGSDVVSFLDDHGFTAIYDPDEPHFNLRQFIGSEQGAFFWITARKLIAKFLEIEIEVEKSPIIQWPSPWTQSSKAALRRKLEDIFPGKERVDVFGPDIHHSANKRAEEWYGEFECIKERRIQSAKQKSRYLKGGKRRCDGCGHSLNRSKMSKSELNAMVFYGGGWPKKKVLVFHDALCVV